METIILETPGKLSLSQTQHPGSPERGQALLKVRRVGICGTDLHAFEGKQAFFEYPRILGHELGIEVLEIGEGVTNVGTGDICTVVPYITCGSCIACRRGKTNCCITLQTLGVHTDGGMREEIILPADLLLPSTTLTLEQLALVETIGIGAHAVDRAQIAQGEWVLVIGAGPIGLGIMEFVQIAGGRIILMELSPSRMAFGQKHYNIEACIDTPGTAVQQLEDICGGDLPTAVLDATGSQRSMSSAFGYVANGGRLVLVGITTSDICFAGSESHRREMTLLNSRNARKSDLKRVMHHMDSGDIKTDTWITHRADPNQLIKEFPSWLDPEHGVVKALLSM